MPHRLPRIVTINHAIRTASFAWAGCVVAVLLHERDASPLAWGLLAAQFLLYPQAVYAIARRVADPKGVEGRALYLDAAFLGAWTASLGFPTWIVYGALFATGLNNAVVRGLAAVAGAWASFAIGALLWVMPFGYTHFSGTSQLVTVLCVLGSLVYASGVGIAVHRQNVELVRERDRLRASASQYRRIVEQAADLLGVVDADGRWRYASPSFARLLGADEVAEGRDAFARVHEEDQFLVRGAVRAVMRGGESCGLKLRLLAAKGEAKRYEALCHALRDDSGAIAGAVLALRELNGQAGARVSDTSPAVLLRRA